MRVKRDFYINEISVCVRKLHGLCGILTFELLLQRQKYLEQEKVFKERILTEIYVFANELSD